ncbi:nitroreductase, partial [Francisella tularensis subsp. holarctica]|nr:nitroreductase [Francisella tularensis subsp. holarctica]
ELTGFDAYILLCGRAIGYEDTSAAVNNYRT